MNTKKNIKNKKISRKLKEKIEIFLNKKYELCLQKSETINISAYETENSTFLIMKIGNIEKAHRFEAYMNETNGLDLDNTLSLLVDFADCIVQEFFKKDRDAWLPIDYMRYTFEEKHIFAKHEYRNFKAEKEASFLLIKSRKIQKNSNSS